MYRTTNGGTTWTRFGNGLPLVRVTDMSFSRNGGLLRIATYGRGIWEIYPHQKAPTVGVHLDLHDVVLFEHFRGQQLGLAATDQDLHRARADLSANLMNRPFRDEGAAVEDDHPLREGIHLVQDVAR